ncbi:MAG: acylpyruvate hydrolase [Maribacter sp.]|jgi:acylpyruvate hydrolase
MKIFCIGRNYVDHAKELNNPIPKKPLLFMKPDTALLIKKRPFFYPEFSQNIHYECEVVLKIGRVGKHIEPRFAYKYIEEVGLGIDFTARDVQAECKKKGHPWEIAKAFDQSAVLGSFVPYADWKDKNIPFTLEKNGEMVQVGNSEDMIFDFATLISYISTMFTLKLGDLIYTGTPAGVGPVVIGDHLKGYLDGQQLLDVRIK